MSAPGDTTLPIILSCVITACFAALGAMEYLARREAKPTSIPNIADAPWRVALVLVLSALFSNLAIWLPQILD